MIPGNRVGLASAAWGPQDAKLLQEMQNLVAFGAGHRVAQCREMDTSPDTMYLKAGLPSNTAPCSPYQLPNQQAT